MSIASRITAIEGHIADDYNALEDIGADLTNVDKNIENIKNVLADIYDDMPKVSESDVESATLSPTRKGAMAIKYKGDTQQDSTTGKNLFDTNGTLYSGSIDKVNNGFKLTNDGTYRTLSIILTTPIPAGTYKCTYNVINSTLSDVNKVTITIRTDNSELANFKVNTNGENTFTINDTATRIYAYISSSETSGATITLDNFMISVNGGDYEPYTGGSPAPSPLYPQEIHNVSGDNTIEICGKNFFNKNTAIRNKTFTSQNVVSDSTGLFVSDYIKVQPSTSYYTNENAPVVLGLDKDKNSLGYIRNASQAGSFTTQANCEYIRIRSYNTTIDMETAIASAMITKGKTAPTQYEAYTGNSQLISLGVENLISKGTISNGYRNSSGNFQYNGDAKGYYFKTSDLPSTITFNCTDGNRANISYYNAIPENGVASQDYSNSNTLPRTISVNKTYTYIHIQFSYNQAIDNPIITMGNHIQYISNTPIELNKISTYQDYIYKDNDRWFLHKEIGKVVLDGSASSWQVNSAFTTEYMATKAEIGINLPQNSPNFISTHFIPQEYAPTLLGYMRMGGTYVCLNYDGGVGGIDNFKTWLQNNNVEVYYVLASSTDTEITDTTLLEQLETIKRSYEGVTNISQENNDLPFILDVSALKEWE